MGGRGIYAHDDNSQIKIGKYLQSLEISSTENLWNNYREVQSEASGGISGQDMRKRCACCMQYSLHAFTNYEQCPICRWIDDPMQNNDITSTAGRNPISLEQARKKWSETHPNLQFLDELKGMCSNSHTEGIDPRSYDLGSIPSFIANTFLTTKRVRICALW